MTRFFWVRHGPTHQKAFTGHRDVPADLSDRAALARLEAALPRDALVVSSDLARARNTADALTGGRERLAPRPGLREFHFGIWDGMGFDAVSARDPVLSRRYWEEPGRIAPPGGESWDAAAARVSAEVSALLAAHPSRDIIVVAHFGVILTRLQIARAVPAAEVLAQDIAPLSMTELRWDGTWHEISANRQI